MGVKSFFTRKVLESKLKDAPPAQREALIKLFEENPELLKKISDEIKEKKKQGQDEMLASVSVMKKYEREIRSLIGNMK